MVSDLLVLLCGEAAINSMLTPFARFARHGFWCIPGRFGNGDIYIHAPAYLTDLSSCPEHVYRSIVYEFDIDDGEDAWVLTDLPEYTEVYVEGCEDPDIIDDDYYWASKQYYMKPVWIQPSA